MGRRLSPGVLRNCRFAADSDSRGGGFAPLRLDCGLRPWRLPLKAEVIPWERGRPARILIRMVVAELPRGFAGSHYVGSNRSG